MLYLPRHPISLSMDCCSNAGVVVYKILVQHMGMCSLELYFRTESCKFPNREEHYRSSFKFGYVNIKNVP